MTKKISALLPTIAFIAIAASLLALAPSKVVAAVNYNRLIDDSIFSNSNSMTAAQINSFLNGFANSCISSSRGFSAVDPTGYSPSTGFTYGSYVSAGTVIYHAAQAYDLNPRVLIATLEKEQSLVTGRDNFSGYCNNGDEHKYAAAVGYGCPDSGTRYSYTGVSLYKRNGVLHSSTGTTCVNEKAKAGFTQQVIRAAWLLKFGQQRSLGNTSWAIIEGNWDNSDDPDTCYGGPMTQGYRKRCSGDPSTTYYDGYTTIDGASIHMDTGATAALYWYTPHKSGNSNFFNIYSRWFGNPSTDTSKDKPPVGNWSGGTSQTPGVKRDTTYFFDNNNDGTSDAQFTYGRTGDAPLVGDWDDDGSDEIGLRRGTSFFLNYNSDGSADAAFKWGRPDDVALVGDWNGDGRTSTGLKRGKTFYLDNNNDGVADVSFSYGRDSDAPLVGDWDGDGSDEIGLRRDKVYYLNFNNDGSADASFSYGRDSDAPLVGDWDDDGSDEIGLRRGTSFFLNYNSDGSADAAFKWGKETDKLIVGDWDGDGKDSTGLKRSSAYYLDNNNDGISDISYVYTY